MPDGLVGTAAQQGAPEERRFNGVVIAQVINNVDITGLGRIQIRLPWLPGVEPWARVAVLMAGLARGTYFMPQPGEEVLVAFNHGDLREPFILGSLWNGVDRPPTLVPTDAINKRLIRTPLGHEIEFDELLQSITITNSTQQKVTIRPDKIELQTVGKTVTLTLGTEGELSIEALKEISLTAPKISIKGEKVEIKSSSGTNISGGSACDIKAGMVRIN